jgi:HAD superfamily hydrolase (TIGR01509 family)
MATTAGLEPIAAVVELLDAAADRGLPCAVASAAARRVVDAGIDALHLRHFFTAVVGVDDVPHGKPYPDLYLHAADRIGVPPADCLAVDDAPDGIIAARRAGMRVLTIADGRLRPVDESRLQGSA